MSTSDNNMSETKLPVYDKNQKGRGQRTEEVTMQPRKLCRAVRGLSCDRANNGNANIVLRLS